MDKLIKILNEIKPGIDFTKEKNIITHKVLCSMDIVRLLMELSDQFDITISPLDVIPENFETVEAIDNLVKKCQEDE